MEVVDGLAAVDPLVHHHPVAVGAEAPADLLDDDAIRQIVQAGPAVLGGDDRAEIALLRDLGRTELYSSGWENCSSCQEAEQYAIQCVSGTSFWLGARPRFSI